MIYILCFSAMSIKTVTKHRVSKTLVIWCFSSMSNSTVTKLFYAFSTTKRFSTMSNRTETKPCTLKVNLPLSFSTMSNRTVTKPRHGPAPDLLALASG